MLIEKFWRIFQDSYYLRIYFVDEIVNWFRYLYRVYDDRGYAKPFFAYQHSSKAFQRSKALITPMRLYWDINDGLVKCIDDAFSLAQKVSFFKIS